jgi:hypothetical protein
MAFWGLRKATRRKNTPELGLDESPGHPAPIFHFLGSRRPGRSRGLHCCCSCCSIILEIATAHKFWRTRVEEHCWGDLPRGRRRCSPAAAAQDLLALPPDGIVNRRIDNSPGMDHLPFEHFLSTFRIAGDFVRVPPRPKFGCILSPGGLPEAPKRHLRGQTAPPSK